MISKVDTGAAETDFYPMSRRYRALLLHVALQALTDINLGARILEGKFRQAELEEVHAHLNLLLFDRLGKPGKKPRDAALRILRKAQEKSGTVRQELTQLCLGTALDYFSSDLFLATVGRLDGGRTMFGKDFRRQLDVIENFSGTGKQTAAISREVLGHNLGTD